MRVFRGVCYVAVALALAGCASGPGGAPSAGQPSADPGAFKACIATDSKGFDDGGETQLAFEGLMSGASSLNLLVGQAQSKTDDEIASALTELVDGGCSLIVTVGPARVRETVDAAKNNPRVNFLLVDAQAEKPQTNVKPVLFDLADGAFLAGYVAATQSAGEPVALDDRSDEIVERGFRAGVDYFNSTHNTHVQVQKSAEHPGQGVRKMVDAAVISTLGEASRGQFSSAPYYGTLKNGGVDIDPLDANVSAEQTSDIEKVRVGLLDGSITPPAAG